MGIMAMTGRQQLIWNPRRWRISNISRIFTAKPQAPAEGAMPRILIVESNPDEVSTALVARAGATLADVYAAALTTIDGTVEIEIISPYDGDDTPDMTDVDGVAFTGSSVEWNTDDDRAAPLAAVMRSAFAAGRPVIGSCNGMQLAASILGGSSAASPNGREDGMATGIELTEAGRTHPMMAGRRDGLRFPVHIVTKCASSRRCGPSRRQQPQQCPGLCHRS